MGAADRPHDDAGPANGPEPQRASVGVHVHTTSKDDGPDENRNRRRKMLTILVCGSRDWTQWQPIAVRLGELPRGCRIIHGGARGADQIAAMLARGQGIPETAYPPDWRGKGRRAGILRNLEMLDERPDLVLAFQRNRSSGTQHTIDEAHRRGIPVEVFRVDDAQLSLV